MNLQYELDCLNTSVKRINKEIEETKRWYPDEEQIEILAGLYKDLRDVNEEIKEVEEKLSQLA